MIASLHIAGFRLFRDITLPKLGHLNLFVGENNSGKSCLLEAVNLYAGQIPISDLVQTAVGRSDESLRPWDAIELTEEGTSVRHPIFELFHRAGQTFTREFIIEKVGDANPLRVQCLPHRMVRDEQDFIRYFPLAEGETTPADGVEMALTVLRGGRQVGLLTRRRLPLVRTRIAVSEKFLNEDALAVAFLPANGLSGEKAASMWDALVQGPGQEMVLDWLRMLDPRIEDLAYVAARRDARMALLKFRGQGRIPLRSMGDGLTKLFHIAIAVASASKGVLLIDEFENGLHWSVQEKLWIAIAKAAREFGVQVFSTTHSRDCIEGFAAAVGGGGPGDAAVYRLERRADDVFATNLPLINIHAAIREHEEVR
jgi:AAA domain, putative AbiEii toxin, Type IV TA system